jgi:hypothetical protein
LQQQRLLRWQLQQLQRQLSSSREEQAAAGPPHPSGCLCWALQQVLLLLVTTRVGLWRALRLLWRLLLVLLLA